MRRTLLTLVALALSIPVPATAQLGGLIKRGAERAADKAVDKAVDKKVAKLAPAPKFDDEVLELTPARIDQVARGLKAYNDARAKADIPGAMKAFEASQKKEQDFSTRYSDQRYAHIEKNRKIEQCRDEVLDAQREANEKEIESKMATLRTDPVRMQAMSAKAAEWAPRMNALMSGTDTAAMQRGIMQMQRELAAIGGFAIDTDSTKANAKCGKAAPAPGWLTAWDSTEVETRRLGDRVREAETAGNAEAAAASGMTASQFAIARERVESFVTDGGMGFSRNERSALEPRKAELKALFPAG